MEFVPSCPGNNNVLFAQNVFDANSLGIVKCILFAFAVTLKYTKRLHERNNCLVLFLMKRHFTITKIYLSNLALLEFEELCGKNGNQS